MVGVCGTEAIPQESVATLTEKEAALGASTKECGERGWRARCFHLCLAGWLGAEFNLYKVTGSQGDLCGSEKSRDDWFPWRWRDGRARAQTSVHLGNSYHFKATFWTVNFFFYWLPLSSWPSLMDSKLLGWFSNCLCVWNYTVRLYPQNLHGTKLIATLSWQRSSLPSCVLGRSNLHVLDCHIHVALGIGQTQPRNKNGRQHMKGCPFFQTWNYLGEHVKHIKIFLILCTHSC